MASLQEKYRELVKRLYEKTKSGDISWQMSYENEIYCSRSKYNVYLRSTRDADGEPLEVLELKNNADQIVDSFDDTDIAGSVVGYADSDNYYQLMASLRHSARRNALGADKALDDVIRDLDYDL